MDEGEILQHAAPGQQNRLLEHHGDVLRPDDVAFEGFVDAGDQAEKRRLADPRGAKNGDGFAVAHLKADIAQDLRWTKSLPPDVDLDHAVLQARARRSTGCRIRASTMSMTTMKVSE